MKKIYIIIIIIIIYSTSSAEGVLLNKYSILISDFEEKNVIDSIINYGKSYLKKPYKYRTSTGDIFDCSGFLNHIFGKFNYKIPKSSSSILSVVQRVSLSDVKPGDLLFFKGRDKASNSIGHVSMVVDVGTSKIEMIHSCNRGVVIDNYYDIDYYKQRFVSAGRLIEDDIWKDVKHSINERKKKADSTKIPSKLVTIIGVGDIMLGTNYPSSRYLPPNDGKDILKPVEEILKNADLTFGNLEGGILTGKGSVKKCSNPKYCYAFKSPDHYVEYLVKAGFDVLSLANNHVGDFGEIGRKNTVEQLSKNGIAFAGLLNYPHTIFTKDSVTYGFCAFSPNRGTTRINNYKQAKHIVNYLDSLCDIVIVSFHGGAEGSSHKNVTKSTEIYLGENRGNPYEFSRLVIDAGADIVFGHGPHVTRAIDIYKDRLIMYSLGNFATYSRFNLTGALGLAPIMKVYVDRNGKFHLAKIISIKQMGEGGPNLDNNNGALKEIIALTKKDFPNSKLKINEKGVVTINYNNQ